MDYTKAVIRASTDALIECANDEKDPSFKNAVTLAGIFVLDQHRIADALQDIANSLRSIGASRI